MPNSLSTAFATGLAIVFTAALATSAMAQSKSRIVCWKDKAGKVVNRNIRADELETELQKLLK
jgi:hypothetical protein